MARPTQQNRWAQRRGRSVERRPAYSPSQPSEGRGDVRVTQGELRSRTAGSSSAAPAAGAAASSGQQSPGLGANIGAAPPAPSPSVDPKAMPDGLRPAASEAPQGAGLVVMGTGTGGNRSD